MESTLRRMRSSGAIVVRRSLAFAAGVSFAAVPAIGPFLALLAVVTDRFEIQRADVWWWISALLLGVPNILNGAPMDAALIAAQVIAVWLIYRSATEFRRRLKDDSISMDIGIGLVVGLAITMALGLRQLGEFRFDLAITTLDAIVWNSHPALFGHAILVIAALLALVVPAPNLRMVALAIGAVGVIFSGSREAVWAWLVIAIGLRFVGRRGGRGTRVAEWVLVVMMAVVVSGLPSLVGIGRTGFLTDFAPQPEDANLFRGTEIAPGDWWFPLGVSYRSELVNFEGQERRVYAVTKDWTESWSRLQQAVTLEPAETYTLSAVVHTSIDTRPGFDGWGRLGAEVEASNLATFLEDGAHRATATGEITVLNSGTVSINSSWQRAFVTFRYNGASPLTWYVGVVPDRSNKTGVTTRFAEYQLTKSYALLPYRQGSAERGVTDLRTSRFPIWRDALDAIRVRPLLGWGSDGFATAVETLHPDEALVRPVAAHAHNALLSAWVERGLIGVLGLVGLFALLALRAVQQRDKAAAIVLLGIAILNTFDSTLLSGSVIYPLAAVLGWRAVGHRKVAKAETGMGSAAAVRVALGFSDALAGASSLILGMYLASRFDPSLSVNSSWSLPLLYATLAWPAASAATRLYPGYGRPSYQELASSVKAAAAAGVFVGFVALLLPDIFGLTAPAVLFAVPAAIVIAPVFRALTKLILRRLRLWGRPVVILGTEPAAERVSKHLLGNPGIGLRPVAAFGSSDSWSVQGLPITGSLENAWDYVEKYGIRHAIVTRDAVTTAAFDQVLLRSGTHLRSVQYLPDLRGLPTNSVVAAPLGTALALEARNQLAYGTNRAFKRTLDFFGASALLVILSLPLILITVLIRLDSRGSPFYLSPRVGRYGKRFNCIKFRTMFVDAEERLNVLLGQQPELKAEYDRYHKLQSDPRVTRLGRILRRLSLDELPQLINVLIGQMSLVGPRPYLVRELEVMGSERDLIFLARPGMTGYWQIEARNDVTFEERQAMEAHYVRNWSVWWDIDILLRTPGVMVGKTGK